jgi:hypothetical protein
MEIKKMPNKNYIKGRRKEYRIMNEAKKRGMIAFRSAGSHSPIDVVCIDTLNKRIKLVQCKPDSMSEKKRTLIELGNCNLNGIFQVEFFVV